MLLLLLKRYTKLMSYVLFCIVFLMIIILMLSINDLYMSQG